jgi:hypothetical protein
MHLQRERQPRETTHMLGLYREGNYDYHQLLKLSVTAITG